MRPKPTMGMRLFRVSTGYNTAQKLTSVEVNKVGRKYFHVNELDKNGKVHEYVTYPKYMVDDWTEAPTGDGATQRTRLYQTEQEYENEKEIIRMCGRLSKAFAYGHRKPEGVSDDGVRKIYKLVFGDKP